MTLSYPRMSVGTLEEKKELMKRILKSLHEGEDVDSLRRRFGAALRRVSPLEIPLIEQELVREGVPVSEILRLCDLHLHVLPSYD